MPRAAAVVRTEPVKPGLTFHGLGHSHKTWMIADLVPEIAQAARRGHALQNRIQQTYSHVAAQVEQRLLGGLQASWEKQSPTPSPTAMSRTGWAFRQQRA